MSRLNGHARHSLLNGRDLIGEAATAELVHNATMTRQELFRRAFDPRRNIYDECGYPIGYVSPQMYQDLYDREAVPARVVEVLPKESWQVQPEVLEDEDPDTDTGFELAWKDLSAALSPLKSWHKQEHGSVVWEYLLRADVLSGIGQYGVIFLGLDDGLELSMPAEGVEEVNSQARNVPPPKGSKATASQPGGGNGNGSKPSFPSTGTPAAIGGQGNGTRPGLPPTTQPASEDTDAYGNNPAYQGTQAQIGPGGVSMGSGYPPSGTPDSSPPGPGFPVQYGNIPPNINPNAVPVGSTDPGKVAAAAAPTSGEPAGLGSLVSPGTPGSPTPPNQGPPSPASGGVRGPGVTPQPVPNLTNPNGQEQAKPQRPVAPVSPNPNIPVPQPQTQVVQPYPGWEPPAAKPAPKPTEDGTTKSAPDPFKAPDGGPPLAKKRTTPTNNTTPDGIYRLTVNADAVKGRKLLYLRVFPESLARVTQFEANRTSPRFGMPVMYLITLNDPTNWPAGSAIGASTISVNVHWSRVIHVVDNSHQATASEVAAAPRMRPVLNNLLNLQKLYGAGSEGYWKSCFTGLSLETNPQLGGDVIVDRAGLRDQVENYQNGLQRMLLLMGMTAKTLAPTVVDPAPHIATNIEAICIKGGYPVRVFKGSERGELASSMDDGQWNDRLRERQHNYLTPRLIAPFVDRLIMLGILPEPEEYRIIWPDLESQTADQKSKNALGYTQALAAFAQIPPGTMTLRDYLTRVWDWDGETVDAIIEAAAKEQEAAQQQADEQAQQQAQVLIDQGVDPEQAAIATGAHGGTPVPLGAQDSTMPDGSPKPLKLGEEPPPAAKGKPFGAASPTAAGPGQPPITAPKPPVPGKAVIAPPKTTPPTA